MIFPAFGLDIELVHALKPELKRIDTRVRMDEREVMILEPALSVGREALWRQEPGIRPLGVRPRMLSPTAGRETYLRAFLWAIEALPDDFGETKTLHMARSFLEDRGISPELPDFSTPPEAPCAVSFSPS